MQRSTDFPMAGAPNLRAPGGGGRGQSGQEGPPGHKRLAVLPGAGQGAGAEARVQGAGRGRATYT